ncbi:MAG: bile acid:sodium symporter family protein [Chitinophagales bacterium]
MEKLSGNIQFNEESLLLLNICIGFILFGIALDLKGSDFKLVLTSPRSAIAGFVSQFLFLPAVTALLIWLFEIPTGYALGMILVAACPGGNISNFISHLAKANTALSVSMTALATASAAVLTPINFTFWSQLLFDNLDTEYFTLDPLKLAETIFLIMAVPIMLGMAFNFKFPSKALLIKKPVRILSMIIFVGFIVIAIAQNFDVFTAHFSEIFLLVLMHNALAYTVGFLVGFILKVPLADKKTIVIETGIQNSALGLVIIFSFFNGAADMALIAAWWGVWHGISGSALAFILSRYR